MVYLVVQLSLLVIIAAYDIRHKIIPDVFAYTFAGLAFLNILSVFIINRDVSILLFDVLAGPICFLPFASLWYFSNGTWMGFGDAKLALGIGWFLGMSGAYVAIVLAFWVGAFLGLGMIMYSKITRLSTDRERVTMKSEIPFGPFLILGLIIMIFFEMKINEFLSTFSIHF